MIIDETTGLPQLEEGYFWQVVDTATHKHSMAYASPYLWVELCSTETEPYEEMTTVEDTATIFNFWRVPQSTQQVAQKGRKRTVVHFRHAMAEFEVFEQGGAPGDGWARSSRSFMVGVGSTEYYRPLASTPENVLKIATKVYDGYMKLKEQEEKDKAEKAAETAARARILGVYPPKNLKEIV